MFKDCPLLALCSNDEGEKEIKLILQDADSQKEINELFELSSGPLQCSDKIEFDGKYTPNSDDEEILFIPQFSLPEYIKNAVENPFQLELFAPQSDELPHINALFVGKHSKNGDKEEYLVSFQKFKNDQYITQSKYHLLYSNDTFKKDNRVGIIVSKNVDCLYCDGDLLFPSYYFARQIFDLSSYYRMATNSEVKQLLTSPIIQIENQEQFVESANSWERRKIASINDSRVLESFSVRQIKQLANKQGVTIQVEDGKIVIPTEKKERRLFLGFLDEEVYKGAFSQITYQTNSKRKAD